MPEVINEFKGAYYFLSNFAMTPLEFEGVMFPSGEHAFAAAKSLDKRDWLRISMLGTPGEAKRYGRRLDLRPYWDTYFRYVAMREIVRAKFTQNPFLRGKLLETGDAILIEGNTWGDTTWGVDLHSGRGHNLLGLTLMDLRNELKPKTRGGSSGH